MTAEPARRLSDRERSDVLLDEVCRLRRENAELTDHVATLTAASFEMMTDSPNALLLDPEKEPRGWKFF